MKISFFSAVKIGNVIRKKKMTVIYNSSAQNIDCGYTLDNEYPKSMLRSKNKKKWFIPVNPSFTVLKLGFRGGVK